ncbi:putative nucleic acid-binding Zn ribbon protein [Haloferula luteola]|uniref:Putative nucleic acid-binding Zn ribbon protein n=1 Tax=Haloferula luteola TaxID=595692 RepID=A0A840V3Y6_9BACT|nr:DUF721 domain-containing protein [Haloferula luteola]MBB5351766.1 putative nucleic acid-binding Zn ribbon protein [Haloferula luteola]
MARGDRLARIRRAILAEWRGGEEPKHPDVGLHRPQEYLGAILQSVGAQEGIDEEQLRELWREIAGDLVARHAAPESLKNGCLTLKVLQPAMRFQLEQMKGRLLANLRASLGEGKVKSIRFSLG